LFGSGRIPSRLCLGAALFGSQVSRANSFALLDAFVEAGGSFLDTAHVYASWLPRGEGASERTIGEWLRARRARESVVLGTKGGCLLSQSFPVFPIIGTSSPDRVREAMAALRLSLTPSECEALREAG
jgi:aryl-alcohol dehydrogenase-like predicted oxidoreductase